MASCSPLSLEDYSVNFSSLHGMLLIPTRYTSVHPILTRYTSVHSVLTRNNYTVCCALYSFKPFVDFLLGLILPQHPVCYVLLLLQYCCNLFVYFIRFISVLRIVPFSLGFFIVCLVRYFIFLKEDLSRELISFLPL